jgi:excisionase family DNA binding protein
MPNPEQIEFPSLAFDRDRKALMPAEVASRLNVSVEHVYDLIAEGKMRGVNVTGANNLSDRRTLRVPVEAYYAFIKQNTV